MARLSEQVGIPVAHQVEVSASRRPVCPLELVWSAEHCLRTERLAQRWLGDHAARLVIEITRQETAPPALHMDESYLLQGDADAIQLRAPTTWGALRALATLAQLIGPEGIPAYIRIEDQPVYPWRGVLIDVARHFIDFDTLLRVLDGMARLKMNVLHLHLSDDQAVRFPSVNYPRLASDAHYTVEQLHHLVAVAADFGIRVVPELDVPGHTNAWLVAYPEWASAPAQPSSRFGVHRPCLNVADDAVKRAVIEIYDELLTVFPDAYVHIGGDEVALDAWSEAPGMQAFHQTLGSSSQADVQNAFTVELVAALNQRGRQVVAWDEVLHPQMPALTVQNWRGATTRDQALTKGLPCVVSAPYYLDLFYPADQHYIDPSRSQAAWLAWEDAQQADPRLKHIAGGIEWTRQWRTGAVSDAPAPANVLGGEACLWAELVDSATLPIRLWSRLPAVAESLWSGARADLEDFYARLAKLFACAPFDIHVQLHLRLQNLGLSQQQIELCRWLEPTKWYARLLGHDALQARLNGTEMPQGRPYGTDTALNQVVDFLPPESLAARELVSAPDSTWLRVAEQWRHANTFVWPSDIAPAMDKLSTLGDLILASKLALTAAQLEAFAEPLGATREYMLAPVFSLLKRLDAERER